MDDGIEVGIPDDELETNQALDLRNEFPALRLIVDTEIVGREEAHADERKVAAADVRVCHF